MIRDTGSVVEFWFKAGYANDWANDLDFNWTVNGVTTAVGIVYPTGAQWKKVGSATVSYSQTITFRLLDATGTKGMGGPTTFNQYIFRATVPEAPSKPVLTNVKTTSVDVSFTPNGNGGATILGYEIGYGLSGGEIFVNTSGPMTITGLTPGTVYLFWVRARNSVGWSPFAGPTSVRTIAGGYIKVGDAWKLAVPYVKVSGEWKLAEPWTRSVGVWKRTT